eukprot:gene15937-4817_t
MIDICGQNKSGKVIHLIVTWQEATQRWEGSWQVKGTNPRFTYGFGVIIFQYDWLHGIFPQLKTVNGAIFWVVPVQSFSIICGLALDYDVFLLTRIIEYRQKGFMDQAALTKAVYRTGRIISFAGVIMAIAFLSLGVSHITLLNEAGAILGVSVLVDTFVIRTILVPAFMSLKPSLNWWPRKLPY